MTREEIKRAETLLLEAMEDLKKDGTISAYETMTIVASALTEVAKIKPERVPSVTDIFGEEYVATAKRMAKIVKKDMDRREEERTNGRTGEKETLDA